MRARRWVMAGAAAMALLSRAEPSLADPQASVGLTIGAAGEGLDYQFWKRRTAFHLGLHADVLFARHSTTDFGVGPYVELMTHAFDEVQFGGGVSGLMPVFDSFPIVLSAGAYGRKGPEGFGVEPGVAGELFWGARSYNFHSRYELSGGLLTQLRCGFGQSRETSIVVAAQVDLVLLALPVLFLVTAARGGSHDTDPVHPEHQGP